MLSKKLSRIVPKKYFQRRTFFHLLPPVTFYILPPNIRLNSRLVDRHAEVIKNFLFLNEHELINIFRTGFFQAVNISVHHRIGRKRKDTRGNANHPTIDLSILCL